VEGGQCYFFCCKIMMLQVDLQFIMAFGSISPSSAAKKLNSQMKKKKYIVKEKALLHICHQGKTHLVFSQESIFGAINEKLQFYMGCYMNSLLT
jgi:hypothetical protein